MTDLAAELIGDREIETVVTGIRPGEKIHEILISEEEATRTVGPRRATSPSVRCSRSWPIPSTNRRALERRLQLGEQHHGARRAGRFPAAQDPGSDRPADGGTAR